jgi:DNA-binding transcriptional ArsR family regulator
MLFAFEFVSILQYKYIAMGITKTEYFTEEQNELALLPLCYNRASYKVNSCVCGDIVNELPLAQPTVSQHLKELKTRGL